MIKRFIISLLIGYAFGQLTALLYLSWRDNAESQRCSRCHRMIRVKPFIRTFHICGGW